MDEVDEKGSILNLGLEHEEKEIIFFFILRLGKINLLLTSSFKLPSCLHNFAEV